jgi:hypothetical protein
MGIKGLFKESQGLIKSLNEYVIKENSKNLPQNEINRRLNIIQDMGNKLENLKLSYEKIVSKSLMVKYKLIKVESVIRKKIRQIYCLHLMKICLKKIYRTFLLLKS